MVIEQSLRNRRGPDKWVKWINVASSIVWVILIIVFFIIGFAKPQFETMFDRAFNSQLRKTWDYELLQIALFLMVGLFFYSFTSILINLKRNKRKEDKIRASLIVSLILSIVGIVSYFFLI